MHEPFSDHVRAPVEFVKTRSDKFLVSPAMSDEIFHVTVVDAALATEPLTATPAKTPTRSSTPPERREGKRSRKKNCTRKP